MQKRCGGSVAQEGKSGWDAKVRCKAKYVPAVEDLTCFSICLLADPQEREIRIAGSLSDLIGHVHIWDVSVKIRNITLANICEC